MWQFRGKFLKVFAVCEEAIWILYRLYWWMTTCSIYFRHPCILIVFFYGQFYQSIKKFVCFFSLNLNTFVCNTAAHRHICYTSSWLFFFLVRLSLWGFTVLSYLGFLISRLSRKSSKYDRLSFCKKRIREEHTKIWTEKQHGHWSAVLIRAEDKNHINYKYIYDHFWGRGYTHKNKQVKGKFSCFLGLI